MLHLIKFQSGHSCVIHAKWGNLGFKKPGSAPYDQVSIWTQLCIHAKCGNLGFKKPGSAVHTLEHQLQQKFTVQILFQLTEWIRVSSLIYRSISTCKFYFKKKISACKMSIQDPVPHVIWEMTPGDRGDFAAPSFLGSCANLCYR